MDTLLSRHASMKYVRVAHLHSKDAARRPTWLHEDENAWSMNETILLLVTVGEVPCMHTSDANDEEF